MKIVDRKTFLAMPAGTIYAKFRSNGSIEKMMMKGTTTIEMDDRSAGDFSNLDLIGEVKCHLGPDCYEILEHAEEKGSSFALDFECYGRDGCFDRDQLFAVWEQPDIEGLIGKLQEALKIFPGNDPIHMQLFPLDSNPFETYPDFKEIWPDREGAPESDVLAWLKDPGTEVKFLICVEGAVVGLTGLWDMGHNQIGLAWHGIVPNERKKGYSTYAIRQLLMYCKRWYPHAQEVVEAIPADREDELRGFFQKLGFVRTGNKVTHPEMYKGVEWMEYVYEL